MEPSRVESGNFSTDPLNLKDQPDSIVDQCNEFIRKFKTHHRAELIQLSELRPILSGAAILKDWLAIFSLFYGHHLLWTSLSHNNTVMCWITWSLFAFFGGGMIAGLQHGLFILTHEGAHYRLFKSVHLNDFIAECFLAFPIGIEMHAYRSNHFKHHADTNGPTDPDWVRKISQKDWQFPKTKREISFLFIRYLWGYGVLEMARIFIILSKKPRTLLWRATAYFLIALAFFKLNLGFSLIVMWIVPLLFVTPLLMRTRSIAEHFGLKRTHSLNQSRNVIPNWWERLLFSPHFIGFHSDHHFFPSVPFYNLPRLNALLMKDPLYSAHCPLNFGYIVSSIINKNSVISDLKVKDF